MNNSNNDDDNDGKKEECWDFWSLFYDFENTFIIKREMPLFYIKNRKANNTLVIKKI